MTTEQRQLLEGDEKREQRGEPKLGWADASSAPPRIAARIIEIRQAILAGHPIPQPSVVYRSQALAMERRLFPTREKKPAATEAPSHVENLRRQLDALGIF